jgi:NADP-dependent aldehyde dehydrogenase
MALSGKIIVAGSLRETSGGASAAVSPITGSELPTEFCQATTEDVRDSGEAAIEAWRAFRKKTKAERARFLETIADNIEALGDELIERCHLESGLPHARLIGERGRTCNQLRLFANVILEGSWVDARITTALPDRAPAPRPDIRRMLVSLGPVAVFGASNFPLAFSVAGGDTASALAAGCPVVVKAHESHPGTSELVGMAIARAAEATGMPAGVFSLLHGDGKSIGIALVEHPVICAVGFTGSYGAGRAIFEAASQRPRPVPVYAEMGSINPVFVLPEAAKERAEEIARGLSASVTLGVGQFCTNPGMVAGLAGKDFDAVARVAAGAISQVDAGVMLNERIRRTYGRGVEELKNHPDVERIGTGRAGDSELASQVTGQAALFKTNSRAVIEDARLSAELFGPSSVLVEARERSELIALAESIEGHLTCTVHGTATDLAEFSDLVEILQEKCGRLIFNGFPTGVEVCDAMTHGGPFPATTDSHFTSVGTAAVLRFARPVSWQGFPDTALPTELQNANPAGILRRVDGEFTRDAL